MNKEVLSPPSHRRVPSDKELRQNHHDHDMPALDLSQPQRISANTQVSVLARHRRHRHRRVLVDVILVATLCFVWCSSTHIRCGPVPVNASAVSSGGFQNRRQLQTFALRPAVNTMAYSRGLAFHSVPSTTATTTKKKKRKSPSKSNKNVQQTRTDLSHETVSASWVKKRQPCRRQGLLARLLRPRPSQPDPLTEIDDDENGYFEEYYYGQEMSPFVVLAGSRSRRHRRTTNTNNDVAIATGKRTTKGQKEDAIPSSTFEEDIGLTEQDREITYRDLSLLGRTIAGTVEVGVVTLIEYLSGLVGGYSLGFLTDLPRLLFRPLESTGAAPASPSFWAEVQGRCGRMHSKSILWGKNWAEISAVLGGAKVLCKVLRGGTEDEWNTVLSSVAAGAFFARAEGPQAMLKGGIIYGALVYFLYGGAFGKRGKGQAQFEYQEEPVVEF